MRLPSTAELLKNEEHPTLEVIRGHQKRVQQLERRAAVRTALVNAANAHFIAGTGNPFNIEDPFTGTAMVYPPFADAIGNFHLFGMNAGVLTWGANSDNGKIVFGGGDGWVDEFGLHFENQEGLIGFLDTAAGETMAIYADGGNFLVLENSYGGAGVSFLIDDASHNVNQIDFTYSGIDLSAGQVFSIGGTPFKQLGFYPTHCLTNSVNASSTWFMCPFIDGAPSATERAMVVTRAGTVKNLYVRQVGNQPASGSLVATVRKNTATDTAATITIAAGAAGPATVSDTSHTAAVAAGDFLGIKLVNNATAASATLGFIAFEIEYDA